MITCQILQGQHFLSKRQMGTLHKHELTFNTFLNLLYLFHLPNFANYVRTKQFTAN